MSDKITLSNHNVGRHDEFLKECTLCVLQRNDLRRKALNRIHTLREAARDLMIAWDDYTQFTSDLDFGTKDYPFPNSFEEVYYQIRKWHASAVTEIDEA